MERMTWKSVIDGHEDVGLKDGVSAGDAILQLAAYEDTGLSPETVSDLLDRFNYFRRTIEGLDLVDHVHFGAFVDRVKHWAQAEKDGRLVVLPCKVGDTVYRVLTTRDTGPIVTEIEIKSLEQAIGLIGKIGEHKLVSWYLTREEAEAALKKREADNEKSNSNRL